MAKIKTIENKNSVPDYLNNISDENRRKDCSEIIKLVSKLTGLKPKMWGTGIVGFGSYHYKYESGHEGEAPLAAFSSRANAIALYLALALEQREELLNKFGKHKTSKGCIYIQKLKDIDLNILSEMISNSIENNKSKYPA